MVSPYGCLIVLQLDLHRSQAQQRRFFIGKTGQALLVVSQASLGRSAGSGAERRPLSVFFGPGDVLEGLGILRVRGSLDREDFENLTCLGELAGVVKHIGFSLQGVVVVRGGLEDFVVVEQGLAVVAHGRQGPGQTQPGVRALGFQAQQVSIGIRGLFGPSRAQQRFTQFAPSVSVPRPELDEAAVARDGFGILPARSQRTGEGQLERGVAGREVNGLAAVLDTLRTALRRGIQFREDFKRSQVVRVFVQALAVEELNPAGVFRTARRANRFFFDSGVRGF